MQSRTNVQQLGSDLSCGASSWCWWVGGGVRKVRGVAQYDAKVRPPPMSYYPLSSSSQPQANPLPSKTPSPELERFNYNMLHQIDQI